MKANRKSSLVYDNNANVRIVGSIVAILAIIVIGWIVYWNISTSIQIENTAGQDTHADLNNTAETIFQLAPIVGIVLVASIILGVITRFGGGSGGL